MLWLVKLSMADKSMYNSGLRCVWKLRYCFSADFVIYVTNPMNQHFGPFEHIIDIEVQDVSKLLRILRELLLIP